MSDNCCPECGWPSQSMPCEACGCRNKATVPGSDLDPSLLLGLQEEDYPDLLDAFAAFRACEWLRYIGICISAAGGSGAAEPVGNSFRWVFDKDSAVVMVTWDRDSKELSIDAPIVDIRLETEVPLLRVALSVGTSLGASRICRRGSILLVTFSRLIASLSPPRLVSAIAEVAGVADGLDNILAAEFGVRMVGPTMRRGHVYDLTPIGAPRCLKPLTAALHPIEIRPVGLSGLATTSVHRMRPSWRWTARQGSCLWGSIFSLWILILKPSSMWRSPTASPLSVAWTRTWPASFCAGRFAFASRVPPVAWRCARPNTNCSRTE
jgi:hypothetical protein